MNSANAMKSCPTLCQMEWAQRNLVQRMAYACFWKSAIAGILRRRRIGRQVMERTLDDQTSRTPAGSFRP